MGNDTLVLLCDVETKKLCDLNKYKAITLKQLINKYQNQTFKALLIKTNKDDLFESLYSFRLINFQVNKNNIYFNFNRLKFFVS